MTQARRIFCQAIRFVALSSHTPLAKAASAAATEAWTLPNVYLNKSTIDFKVEAELSHEGEAVSFSYELSLKVQDPTAVREDGGRLSIKRELLSVDASGFENTPLIRNNDGRVRLLHETKSRSKEAQYVDTHAPTDEQC